MKAKVFYISSQYKSVYCKEISNVCSYLNNRGIIIRKIDYFDLDKNKDFKFSGINFVICESVFYEKTKNILEKYFIKNNDFFLENNTFLTVLKIDSEIITNIDKCLNALINKTEYQEFNLYGVSIDKIDLYFSNLKVKALLRENDGIINIKINKNHFDENSFDILMKDFLSEFGNNIYAQEDMPLNEYLIKYLKYLKYKISCAESFTGGKISSLITSISGSSSVFYEGAVTYDCDAKISRLGVEKSDIQKYKPVSSQVAYQMCYGLLKTKKCDFAISTTGIAGPNSDDSNFPVGLCYIGVGTLDKISVFKFNFTGTRFEIINKGAQMALFLAIKELKKI